MNRWWAGSSLAMVCWDFWGADFCSALFPLLAWLDRSVEEQPLAAPYDTTTRIVRGTRFPWIAQKPNVIEIPACTTWAPAASGNGPAPWRSLVCASGHDPRIHEGSGNSIHAHRANTGSSWRILDTHGRPLAFDPATFVVNAYLEELRHYFREEWRASQPKDDLSVEESAQLNRCPPSGGPPVHSTTWSEPIHGYFAGGYAKSFCQSTRPALAGHFRIILHQCRLTSWRITGKCPASN